MTIIKAVVFDFDGLIVDTESKECEAWEYIYKQYGVKLPQDLWCLNIGTNTSPFNVYNHLEQLTGTKLDLEQIRQDQRAYYHHILQNEPLRPGVREYLLTAQSLGLRIGLASSSTNEWVRGFLDLHRLTAFFEVICTADDVLHVKPDPALYIKALSNLQTAPAEAVAFEDSPNGALAAERAGMHCVIVPNTITSGLTFGQHDLRLESMQMMGLPAVLAYLMK